MEPTESINARLRDARDLLDNATNQEAVWGPCAPLQDVLRAVRDARAELDGAEASAVAALRSEGASWESIGSALGVTKQAAQQRYGQ